MSRKDFKKIAEDTYKKSSDYSENSKAIFWESNGKPIIDKVYSKGYETEYRVLDESCIQTVLDMSKDGKESIGLMNFASAKNPGGGFLNGSQAQEEAIARVSNLAYMQEPFLKELYVPNRKDNLYGLYTNHFLTIENVCVFKQESGDYLENPIAIHVVSVPAPNKTVTKTYEGHVTNSDIKQVLRLRIDNTLQAFMEMGSEHIILGAFGCGVFGNSPTDVAKIFRQLLNTKYKGCFKSITFSVISGNSSNFKVFNHYFGEERKK